MYRKVSVATALVGLVLSSGNLVAMDPLSLLVSGKTLVQRVKIKEQFVYMNGMVQLGI